MNITLIEPFYSGSHKQFADQLKKYSRHQITLLTLDGKFWKWRVYGGAQTLAEAFNQLNVQTDLLLVTDMLDLPTFIGATRHKLNNIPIINYFHENQIAYPWKSDSDDKQKNRDVHYGMVNYHSASVSDYVLFNSAYNMNSFIDGIEHLLNRMPDHKHTHFIQRLRNKSQVMALGLELNNLLQVNKQSTNELPLILWNHRWEHDKNPEAFFKALYYLKDQKVNFRLAVVGESYKNMPEIFKQIKIDFTNELIHYGYASYEDYIYLLNKANILPVTSNHEFFGISVMEAIHCGAIPLLPKRLSYVELYNPKANPEIFYTDQDDLNMKLKVLCSDILLKRNLPDYKQLTEPYDWKLMVHSYDRFFDAALACVSGGLS